MHLYRVVDYFSVYVAEKVLVINIGALFSTLSVMAVYDKVDWLRWITLDPRGPGSNHAPPSPHTETILICPLDTAQYMLNMSPFWKPVNGSVSCYFLFFLFVEENITFLSHPSPSVSIPWLWPCWEFTAQSAVQE